MDSKTVTQNKEVAEKIIVPKSGLFALVMIILACILSLALLIAGGALLETTATEMPGAILLTLGFAGIILSPLFFIGLKSVAPNEAIVLLLFGKYYGTVSKAGFYFVNIFCRRAQVGFGRAKLSLKALTFNNEKQKVNDEDGNPIEIGVVVIWKVVNTAKAIFNVDNYQSFVSMQADSAIRHVARQYPYDIGADGDEKSLRGSSQEVADALKLELQTRVDLAGIEILDTRISHLAYAPEIAAAMLQRQQAGAIIAARQKIVEGAVSMVEMALNKIAENKIVEFDAEKKAQMVSNLLVILCGNKDAQPIVNSGV